MAASPILQVVIGLFLIFFVFSTLASGLAELINRWMKIRADFLLRGIKTLLDGAGPEQRKQLQPTSQPTSSSNDAPGTGSLAEKLLKLPIVGTLGQENDGDPLDKKYMPSYLPGRTFAAGIMDILVPNADGRTTISGLIVEIDKLPEPVRSSLLSLAKGAQGSVAAFRLAVSEWYDDQMDRVAGWYKRHIRRIIIVFAIVFAVLFNINVVTLARTLYTDPSARDALVTQAEALQQCPEDQRDRCTEEASRTVISLGKSTLPLFWQPTDPACALRDVDPITDNDCGFLEARNMDGFGGIALALLGWAIAAAAFSMGGPFWFDLLGKVASLRGAGNPPPKASGS